MSLSTIESAIEDIRAGKMFILVDDEDRENEGDLTMAAEKVTPEAINFMARYGRGLICLALAEDQVNKLKLPMMTSRNTSMYGTNFTVSIEAKHGVTTGISAHDRATTILTAIADESGPEDIAMPGHVFPLKAREGGVLVRAGQTEGSVDLARLAGLKSSGVICEIMKDDGTMARMPDLEVFSKKHDLKIVTIADLIAYRLRTESFVNRDVETRLPSRFGGEWKLIVYSSIIDPNEIYLNIDFISPLSEAHSSELGSMRDDGHGETALTTTIYSKADAVNCNRTFFDNVPVKALGDSYSK